MTLKNNLFMYENSCKEVESNIVCKEVESSCIEKENVNYSICIPKVMKNITKSYIYDIFYKLNIGMIKEIIITFNSKTQDKFVIIHFYKWFSNNTCKNIKNLFDNNNYFKMVYNFPHFWKCYKYSEK